MKTWYIGEHIAIEFNKQLFFLGIAFVNGAFMIDLGFIEIKFY